MQLSIIIINYNSAQLILDCLATIFSEENKISFEIIIVDNASPAKDKRILFTSYPGVKWVQMTYNSGFARANNEGIRHSAAPVVLLLNPDTLIKDKAIEKCYTRFVRSDYVACGVHLLNPDNTPQISGNYVMRGGLNHLLPLPYLGNFFKWLATIFKVKKTHILNPMETVDVDWINGAFLMVKKTAIEKAGLLDEDFFLYAEEAEWCSRLKKTGTLCIYGDISIIHLQGEIAGKSYGSPAKGYKNLFDKKGLQIMLSNFVRIRKQFGVFWFVANLFIYCIAIPVFFFGNFFSGVFSRNKHSFEEVRGYSSNIFYIVKLVPKIIRNKPFFYKT